MSIFKRKPWRSRVRPFAKRGNTPYGVFIINQCYNLAGWVRHAHDCQDPRVNCSCAGSYRFPFHHQCAYCHRTATSFGEGEWVCADHIYEPARDEYEDLP
jgi:hypothetical protein